MTVFELSTGITFHTRSLFDFKRQAGEKPMPIFQYSLLENLKIEKITRNSILNIGFLTKNYIPLKVVWFCGNNLL